MSQQEQIKIFESAKVRTVWDDEREEWYFSIVDVCAVLTDQPDYDHAKNYWKVLKHRLIKEGNESVTNCNQLKLVSPKDGKRYKTDVATPEQLFRIIQSVPSKKAEPTARILVKGIYLLQNKFPKEERYALGDQIRRSSSSITSNIAEGAGRNSIKEKIHFIEISFGSMTESFSQLQLAQDLGYIQESDVNSLRPIYNKVAAQLSAMKNTFQKKITP